VARLGSNALPVNGGQVRDTWFCPAGKEVPGYDARQVDDLLHRVVAELDAGGSAGQLIQNATFRRVNFGRRYDIDAVDRFLDRFLSPGHFERGEIVDDPWWELPVAQFGEGNPKKYSFYSRCENAWRDFGQVPGTRLWFGKATRGLNELRTAEQQTLASVRGSRSKTFSTGGRSFTLQRTSAGESSSPAVAALLARAAEAEAGHYIGIRIGSDKSVLGLVGETGTPILYTTGSNYNWRACAYILFPDLLRLRFLVRGTRENNAIMTAVDQAGNRVARYRSIDKSGRQVKPWSRASPWEIIVHPGQKLTDDLALALALSASWLGSYFERPGGGG
jgi:hypothetical protein